MIDCLFCKIIAKEIPSACVYEDDAIVAFLDIHPTQPGHVLVVPRQHSEGFHDATPETLHRLIDATQKIAKAILVAVGSSAFNLEQNNGVIAGQVIPHLHFHIIPRFEGDGLRHWSGKEYAEGEQELVAEQIRKALTS